MNPTRWRKSTRSNVNGNCVELAHTLDQLRDSKNPTGPALTGNITAFLTAAKAGTLDR